MLPKTHIVTGAIFSLLLLAIFPQVGWLNAAIVFLASFLIDVDHYWYYMYKKKDRNLKRAYQFLINKHFLFSKVKQNKKGDYKKGVFILHGIEFWLVIILLVIVNEIFIWILIGITLHMVFDFIELYQRKEPFLSKVSQVHLFFYNKNKKEF
jgi:Ca2+/Na+ antiporter